MPKARAGVPAIDLIPIVLMLLLIARSTTGLYPTADIHGLGIQSQRGNRSQFQNDLSQSMRLAELIEHVDK